MADTTYYVNEDTVALREIENPGSDWVGGMNASASNACGIGINPIGGAVLGTNETFTLNDQTGLPRTPQNSSNLGGLAYVPNTDYPSSGGTPGATSATDIFVAEDTSTPEGVPTKLGSATLNDIETGWEAV